MDLSEPIFSNDPVARRVIRGALLWEIVALVIMILPGSGGHARPIGQITAFAGLCVTWLGLAWLYALYGGQEVVRQRQALGARMRALRRRMQAEHRVRQGCARRRDRLAREERAELAAGLRELQATHIASGLAATRLVNANIPGLGPALKERLSTQGLGSAADVNATELLSIRGLGDVRSQALLDWRNELILQLKRSMPVALPARRTTSIHRTFERQHRANEREEDQARARQADQTAELEQLRPQLEGLVGATFGGFVRFCLGGDNFASGLAIVVLIIGQVVLLSSLGFSAQAMARPQPTPVSVVTRAATRSPQQGERPILRPITPAPPAARRAQAVTTATPFPKSPSPKVTTRSTRTRRVPVKPSQTRERGVRPPASGTRPATGTAEATRSPLPATKTPTPIADKRAPTGTVTTSATVPTIPAGEFQNLVNLTSPIARGGTASITVSTNAGATCSIKVYYKSGASKSKALSPITAGADGLCNWTWKISTRTAPGNWSITVRTGSVEVKYAFVVT